jgi:hypothetical protein
MPSLHVMLEGAARHQPVAGPLISVAMTLCKHMTAPTCTQSHHLMFKLANHLAHQLLVTRWGRCGAYCHVTLTVAASPFSTSAAHDPVEELEHKQEAVRHSKCNACCAD